MVTEKELHNIILIHTARTWERMRVLRANKEMPQDNIQSSTDAIPEIAYIILQDDVMQALLSYKGNRWTWERMTKGKAYASDEYIEYLAHVLITNNYGL